MNDDATQQRMHRIPLALQSVFLRSNRGEDVQKAPPERMGNRVFLRNIFFRRPTSIVGPKKKGYNSSKDHVLTKGARRNAKSQKYCKASSSTTNDDHETIEVRRVVISVPHVNN